MTLTEAASSRFEDLFLREYPRIVSVAYRITRDAADAEDVAQEVFTRFAGAGRINDAKAPAWLHAAAVHVALNGLRAQRRRQDRESRAGQLERALRAAGDSANPQQIAEREFDRDAVRRALRRLAKKDTEILALRYGGLSYREVADALRVDVAQIGTRLARAERAFRRELEREHI